MEQGIVDEKLVEAPKTSCLWLEENSKDELLAFLFLELWEWHSDVELVVGFDALRVGIVLDVRHLHFISVETQVVDGHYLVFIRSREQVVELKRLMLVQLVLVLVKVRTVEIE